ncbi:hypothetical protein DY023_06580 [Microbacterium bovistercoris]|uniref:Uncharacterized protein n=1 Tax=Microbacterium bovistercoris TaxID=2293570 RepID=A0A371NW00_9MICO|nr:hypothetical protein [Microbacterium bovistercoris]REJ06291.1 hypothetical protein DY023_06580 [Microbacterium bovistercoris]
MNTLTARPPQLAVLADIDKQIAELVERRVTTTEEMLADLDWMETPLTRLPDFYAGKLDGAPVGTRVHIVAQYEERPRDEFSMMRFSTHTPEACEAEWCCAGEAGGIVKGGGPTRWRFRCEGTFEFIGSANSGWRGSREFLFIQDDSTQA